MRRSLIFFLAVGTLILASWIWFKQTHPDGVWHYRLMVTVETPEGVRSGSSVIRVNVSRDISEVILPRMTGSQVRVIGEAVAVDMGKRGYLFALLRSERGGPGF